MRTDTPKTIYLKDYAPPAFALGTLDLTFRIFDDHTEVTAHGQYTRQGDHTLPLTLMGHDMNLVSTHINGVAVTPQTIPGGIALADVPDEFTLEIVTTFDPRANTELEGLFWSNGTYCTQCEPEGFRRITYAPDRPDVMSIYTVRIEGDKKSLPVLLSNGNLVEAGDLSNGRHFAVWHDPFPKPSYLFALVAGDLVHVADRFTTMSGRHVDLRIYVRDGDQGQCAHAMESLKKAMKWDEVVYGREYDLDLFNIVAVSDFNMGAMENKSLNIFNSAYVLAHPDTATDMDFFNVEAVVAHEYFHNWTGNRITCRDWFQLSLKEGLTVFRDQEFSADHNSRAVCRIDDVTTLRRGQFPEDSSPLAHPIRPDNYIEINNFYTMTVYEKGAEVIRMFHTLLGAQTYRKATDLYFDRHDGQAVTCDDFAQCMADASGLDLAQFKLWYAQAGTPEVSVQTSYDATARRFTLSMAQQTPDTPGQSHKKPLHIPVRIALYDANGGEMDLGQGAGEVILHLRDAEQRFTFENIASRPVPSMLRGFSAPIKLTTDLTDADLRFLMVHDTDGFNRWDAAQTVLMREIQRLLSLHTAGKNLTLDPQVQDAFVTLMAQAADDRGDLALLARMLSLPDTAVIAQAQAVVDIAAIHTVRQFMLRALGQASAVHAQRIFDFLLARSTTAINDATAADRSLMGVMLRLWSMGSDAGAAAAVALYRAAKTMTDRVNALTVLTHIDHPERAALFADFYERFKNHELVVNKWFSLQALSTRPGALDDVATLATHSAFSLKNPNRARSLWGAFGMNNPVALHDPSGRGYKMLMDVIIQLNTANPSVAARLLTPFREWRRFTPAAQKLMRAELDRLLALPDLSRAVFEIASKSVAA